MFYVVSFFVLGTIVGGQINHAIYRFAFFSRRPISPWMTPHPKAARRNAIDYVPLVGWTMLNREEKIHGSFFWLRPFLIELGSGTAFAGLYLFHIEYSGLVPTNIDLLVPLSLQIRWSILVTQLVLFALLTIATFIDFDEFIIPDQVTVTGVIFFLTAAAIAPGSMLPDLLPNQVATTMTFASPSAWPPVASSTLGLIAVIGCIWFWCLALIPKTCTFRKGVKSFFPIMMASIFRKPRLGKGAIPIRPRRMERITILLASIALLSIPILITFWTMAADKNRISLLTSAFGVMFGMNMIWAIRIVGKLALQKEAMGFGDVTLMAMIGSYVGWQACLPILAISAIAALLITLPIALLRWNSCLPYGPYLSIGTVAVILGWNPVWEHYFKNILQLFGVGNVFMVLVLMTIPMFLLLLVTRFVKERIFGFH